EHKRRHLGDVHALRSTRSGGHYPRRLELSARSYVLQRRERQAQFACRHQRVRSIQPTKNVPSDCASEQKIGLTHARKMGKGSSCRLLIVDLGRRRRDYGDLDSRLAHTLRLAGAAKLSSGGHNGCDDSRVPSAAANLTTELAPDGLSVRMRHTPQNVPRHHQHTGRAKSALNAMRLMEMPTQYLHRGIALQPFEGLHGTAVAHDRKSKARAGGLSIHSDRAGATGSVLAPEMGCRQATAFAQEICKGFPRLHVAGDFGTVQFKR